MNLLVEINIVGSVSATLASILSLPCQSQHLLSSLFSAFSLQVFLPHLHPIKDPQAAFGSQSSPLLFIWRFLCLLFSQFQPSGPNLL